MLAARAIHAYPQAAASSKPPMSKTLSSEADFFASGGGTASPDRTDGDGRSPRGRRGSDVYGVKLGSSRICKALHLPRAAQQKLSASGEKGGSVVIDCERVSARRVRVWAIRAWRIRWRCPSCVLRPASGRTRAVKLSILGLDLFVQ